MVAFVRRLDQEEADRPAKLGDKLGVGDGWRTHDVDRSFVKVLAIGCSANSAVVRYASDCGGHPSKAQPIEAAEPVRLKREGAIVKD